MKTRYFMGSDDHVDGCATFYNTKKSRFPEFLKGRFVLLSASHLHFNDSLVSQLQEKFLTQVPAVLPSHLGAVQASEARDGGANPPVFVGSIEFGAAERAADAVLPRQLPFVLGPAVPGRETPAVAGADAAAGEGGV